MALTSKFYMLEEIDYLRMLIDDFWGDLTEREQTILRNRIVRNLDSLQKKFGSTI